MRRHGAAARNRSIEVGRGIESAMWSMRVIREARVGAIIVAGQHGEVLRVDSCAPDGYGVNTSLTPFHVKPEVLRSVGPKWVQSDLKALGDAPCSVHGHVVRDRRASAASSLRPGVDLRRTNQS